MVAKLSRSRPANVRTRARARDRRSDRARAEVIGLEGAADLRAGFA